MFYREINFKDTPVGKIPKEWEIIKLENYAYIKGRIGWRGLKASEYTEKGPYLIANKHIINQKVIWNICDHISEFRYEESPEIQLEINDIIMSKDGTIGQVAFIDHLPDKATINSTMMLIRAKNRALTARFMYYFLQGPHFRRFIHQKISGTSIPHIFQRDMKNLNVLLPPLPEQQKIVEILSIVDKAIQKVDEIIAKTERLKKGLMHKLLTKGIGHKEFKDTEIGRIPREWKVVRLRDIVDNKQAIVAGPFGSNLKVSDYRPAGVPIIRLQNIERNRFIDKDIKYTSAEKAKELSYHSYQPGDLVLAKLGDPIGKTCIVPTLMRKGIVVADVVRIRLTPKKATTKFIEYMLNSSICFSQLRKETIGSTRPRVNISQVRNLKLFLPPLNEQQKIAEILSAVDKKLELERNEKAKLERIKQSLMDLLLTGKIRVKVM